MDDAHFERIAIKATLRFRLRGLRSSVMTDATTLGIIAQPQKRLLPPTEGLDLPRKKSKAMLANDDSDSEDSHGGVPLQANSDENHVFSINQEFARRFEHNKRREEAHRRQQIS